VRGGFRSGQTGCEMGSIPHMKRTPPPKGQVFLKKEEKLAAVAAALSAASTTDAFIDKFRELYPGDWTKIVQRYELHEKQTPHGKSHPMAPPRKYLANLAKKYIQI